MESNDIAVPIRADGLQRRFGLRSTIAAVAGEMIAVGIFLTPAGMAKSLGSPLWLLLVWIVVGAMTLSGALCFGELAGRFPRTGGIYVYLQEAYGRRIAFLYGWMCLLVLDPGISAALATGIAGYAAYIFHWPPLMIKGAAVALIAALCGLNIVSIRLSAGFMRWLTWLKFGVLGLLVFWAVALRLGSWSNFVPFVAPHSGSLPLAQGLAVAMIGAFFSYGGWWDVSKIAGEIRDPGRTLPRAMLWGVLAVTAVYIFISTVFLYLVPLEKVTSGETFVAQAGAVLFGPAGGTTFAAIVVLCVLGSLATFMMLAPRVYYAMAEDGLFLKAVARLHPKFKTPVTAIVIQGAIASSLILAGNFQQIIAYFFFTTLVFLGMAVAGLFIFRHRRLESELIVLTPAYPATPLAFLLLVALILVLVAIQNPRETLFGTTIVLLGLPVYGIFQRKRMDRTDVRPVRAA